MPGKIWTEDKIIWNLVDSLAGNEADNISTTLNFCKNN
jgi:hypothetical protein